MCMADQTFAEPRYADGLIRGMAIKSAFNAYEPAIPDGKHIRRVRVRVSGTQQDAVAALDEKVRRMAQEFGADVAYRIGGRDSETLVEVFRQTYMSDWAMFYKVSSDQGPTYH